MVAKFIDEHGQEPTDEEFYSLQKERLFFIIGQNGRKLVDAVDHNDKDKTFFLKAVELGYLEFTKIFGDKFHSDVHVCDVEGYSALHLAVLRGHLSIC